MKFLRKFLAPVTALAVAGGLFFSLGGGVASAACQYQYTSNNMQTSTTPVFNSICGVPTLFNSTDGQYAFGDESDFVRIRNNTSGDVTSNKNNPKLVGDKLTSACTAGSKYDVLTYIHNDASADFNDNGNGSAVAHNTKLAMDAAGIGTTNTQFKFSSAVTADAPAVGATDSVTLDCNGHQVQLKLVAGSVRYNPSFMTSTNWAAISDTAVNNTTKIGSPNWGTGDMWGCWDYVTAVVYQVSVTEVPVQPQVTATCDLFDILAADDRTVKVKAFNYTAKNTAFKDATIYWDAKNPTGATTPGLKANEVAVQTHKYSADGTYLVKIAVNFTNPDSTANGVNCEKTVTFSSAPPVVTVAHVTPAQPTRLVNTGPGSILAMFAAVSVAGATAYRWVLARRLTDR